MDQRFAHLESQQRKLMNENMMQVSGQKKDDSFDRGVESAKHDEGIVSEKKKFLGRVKIDILYEALSRVSDEITKQRSSNVIEDEKLMEPHPLTELDRISKNVELLESNAKNSEEDDAN